MSDEQPDLAHQYEPQPVQEWLHQLLSSSLPTIPIEGPAPVLGPPRCNSCGSEERDLRRHSDECVYRQAQRRRCEEAVDEWDGPQLADPQVPRPIIFGDFRREYHLGDIVTHPSPYGAIGELGPRRFREDVGIPLENGEGYLAYAPFDTAHHERLARINRGMDALEEALRQPAQPVPVDPARLHLLQSMRGEPQPWHEELTRPGPERVYAYRRQSRRQHARRALRTMLARFEIVALAALSSIVLISSLFVQGVVPALAWLAGWSLIVYAAMLHLFLGAKFWRAYRSEGGR